MAEPTEGGLVYEIVDMNLHPKQVLVRRGQMSTDEMGQWMPTTFHLVARFIKEVGGHPTGMPFARFEAVEGKPGHFHVDAGFPVAVAIPGHGDVVSDQLPGGRAAHTWHTGPYEEMEEAYRALIEWITDRHGKPYGAPWEVYHSDPVREPDPTTWRTEIYMPYHLDFI